MAGRAIRDRTMIIDDAAPRPQALRAVDAGFMPSTPPGPMLAASIPLIRDRAVLGALTLMRDDRSRTFTELERGLNHGPLIDPDAGVYPMVGPGQPYETMITGDWIPSRKKVDVKPPGA